MENVLLDPEVWDTEKIEVLFSQGYNISGKYVVCDTALSIERISTDTEGCWHYEIEVKGETGKPFAKDFNTFQALLEYLRDS